MTSCWEDLQSKQAMGREKSNNVRQKRGEGNKKKSSKLHGTVVKFLWSLMRVDGFTQRHTWRTVVLKIKGQLLQNEYNQKD